MRAIWKFFKSLLALFGFAIVFWIGAYFLVPEVNQWTNENVFKIEQNSSNKEEVESLQIQIEEKEAVIVTINSQLTEEKNNVTQLETEIAVLTSEKETLEADFEANKEELAEVNSLLEEKLAELNSAQETVNSLESELALKEVEIASLNQQIERYESASVKDPDKLYIEDFLNNGKIYAFDVGNNKFLISAESGETGVYVFDKINYSIKQVFKSFTAWDSVSQLPNGNFIVSTAKSTKCGVCVYNPTDDTFEQLSTAGKSFKFLAQKSDTEVFVAGSILCVLNLETKEVKTILTGATLDTYMKVDDYHVFSSTNGSFQGLWFMKEGSDSVTKLSGVTGLQYTVSFKLSDGRYLIKSSIGLTTSTFLILADFESATGELLSRTAYEEFYKFIQVDNFVLMLNKSGNGTYYVDVLNLDTKTITENEISGGIDSHEVYDDYVKIYSSNPNRTDVYHISRTTGEVTKVA